MAIQNIDTLNLGDFLQIVFSDGIRNQISEDYRDWEYIARYKYGNTAAREYRFLFQDSYGPSATQYRDPGASGRRFPRARQIKSSEYTAKFKEIESTIELEYNLWNRARKSPEKYAEPLAAEIAGKTISQKRRMAADLYADGTGVIGTTSGTETDLGSGKIKVTLKDSSRGHVGFFEFGDLLTPHNPDGTVVVPTGSTDLGAYEVLEKDREAGTVTLQALTSSLAANTSITATNMGDGDVFYRGSYTASGQSAADRDGQSVIADLGSISDYGTATDVIAGLESLANNDGRVIHGMTLTGATAGSRVDAGGNPLDVKFIQKALSQGKNTVGQGAYVWKMLCMSPESYDVLIESRETDRRFQTITDNTRGTSAIHYMHASDNLEAHTSEYCPQDRIWMMPENKSNGGRVMEYIGSDFETVKGPNMTDFHLKPAATGGGHVNTVTSYLQGIGVLVCKHPAAMISISNFANE